jgi:hypothetical protein
VRLGLPLFYLARRTMLHGLGHHELLTMLF